MLDIFISPLLQVLIEKLVSFGISHYLNKKQQIQINETIKKWKVKLGEIEAVLSDAEQQQFHNNAVKLWLQNLHDWAYDLEDILDDFVTQARLKDLNDDELQEDVSRVSCSPLYKVPCFSCCAVGTSSHPKSENYSNRIEQISIRLQDILSRAGTLNLVRQTQLREVWQEKQTETSSLVQIVYGREDEKHMIIQRLLEDVGCSKNYIVVPVVGQGGIGKTTLAQSVYNDERVKSHFAVKAWVCVSDVFNVKQITTAIINSSTNASDSFSDLNGAQEKLQDILDDKRFLIILDDIWNDEYSPWDQLQIPFQAAAKGSRVIVTTRIEKVARNMLTESIQCPSLFLKGLSDDDCWLLFKQHALVNDNPVETRNEVIGLCKGLPLVAKALGGLLRKEDKTKWPKILNSNAWVEEGGVLPALRLSYHHLPHHLKRVFSYCSIFPKDHEFLEKNAVSMWIAEGFLPKARVESMEDIDSTFFHELVSRSIFEPSPSNVGYFIMHDLIHELAQWAAGEVCCIMDMDIRKVSCRTRYLSFPGEVLEEQPWISEKVGDAGSQLRTFAFLGYTSFDPPLRMLDVIFQRFQYLRVLSMSNMRIKKLPDSIGNLKHLRLLDLSFNWKLNELPESTSKLCNLQTLLLKSCTNLRKVVTNMALITELRHLDIDGTTLLKMPIGIGKLTNLQTLNRFFLTASDSGKMISELSNLNCLRGSLDIFGLLHVVSSTYAQEARLHEKSGLSVLRMFWENPNSWRDTPEVDQNIDRDVLEQLRPHKSIKKLCLNGYRDLTFPGWLGNNSFNEMVIIKLESCPRCKFLPPLGQLPSLKELWVERMDGIKTIGSEFYGADCSKPFPSLETLRFDHMECWEEWCPPTDVNSKSFFHLEKLEISWCPLLQGNFPTHLPSLKKLKIDYCDKLRVLLPRLPLLQELEIRRCAELSSSSNVIRCSQNIMLTEVSQFTGFDGFWIPGMKALVVVDVLHLEIASDKCLLLVKCPKLQRWRPDAYGKLNKLSNVALGNCEELSVFLENEFPSSVKYLTIYGNDSLRHISKLTNRSTCLRELHIEACSSLATVDHLPCSLEKLVIKDVKLEQPAHEWELHHLSLLKNLAIINVGNSVVSVNLIPEPDLRLPSSITDLTIIGFQNLNSISLSSLPNLTKIFIQNCPLMSDQLIQFSNEFKIRSRRGRKGTYFVCTRRD